MNGERVHMCARYRQCAHDHGTTDPTAWCWGCEANPKLMPWWNGLDLKVGCKPVHEEMNDAEHAWASDSQRAPLILTEDETFTNVSRREWQQLQVKHGPLTPLEEALICRLTACTTVLKMPSERQLGYKGNIINLVNDLATVCMQLPLAPPSPREAPPSPSTKLCSARSANSTASSDLPQLALGIRVRRRSTGSCLQR